MAEVRINVEDAFLDSLKQKLGTTKTNEVIQEALTMLDWGADAKLQGRDILSANVERSDFEKVVLPRLSKVKAIK
jgi:hypothetical protein